MIRLDAVEEIIPICGSLPIHSTSLYMWKKGFHTLNYGLSGLKVVQNANKGGCQVYDRKQDALDTIHTASKGFSRSEGKARLELVWC
jgi:hypothetical protein